MDIANIKKFYLIHKADERNDDTILWLETQKDGYKYLVLYYKLLLRTADTKGKLAFNMGGKQYPMSVNDIANITRLSVATVMVGLNVLQQLGLVEVLETPDSKFDLSNLELGSGAAYSKERGKAYGS